MWLYKFVLQFSVDGYIVKINSGAGAVLEPFFSYMKQHYQPSVTGEE
jgi:hypothetical protein